MARTLEQALIEYLFPKNGPQDHALKSYGADELTRHLVSRLPNNLQHQLIRLCDVSPVMALDLIHLVLQVADECFEAGRDDAMNREIPEAEERGRSEERIRLSRNLSAIAKELSQ